MRRRSLVVTADDFGLAREVNEAVEEAHRDGILTAASLMVAEPWAADAVERARRLPDLAVGLHLAVVEGTPVLPRADIPDLLGPDGKLRTDLARYGADIVLRPRILAQLAAEIETQFQAYAATGLALDHVDAHKHYHLHPAVARLVLAIGPRYGMRALRVPVEPAGPLLAVEPATRIGFEARLAGLYAARLRAWARRDGFAVADQVLGLSWSGAITSGRLAGLIRNLPPGRTEIFLHPGRNGSFAGSAPSYLYAAELAALTSEDARRAVAEAGAGLSSCAAWAREGAG